MTSAVFVGRVGGLAAALGVGVVIGLSSAAQASADAGDSSARHAAASDSPSSHRRSPAVAPSAGVASAAAARPSEKNRAAPMPATARLTVAAAKPEVASSPVDPVSPDLVAEAASAMTTTGREARQAVTSPVPAPVAPAVTAPAATASSPGPIMRFLQALFNCDPRGRLITIYKGTHFAIPNNFGFFVQKVSGTGTFTSDTVYDLKDVDQYDWNKFTGIAFTPLEPDRDSVMVGWRYNLTSREFEIAPFYNVNKARILPNEQTEVISVPADQTFQYLVNYTGVTLTYGDKKVFKPFPPGLTANVWTAARVSGWFGGNEVAPRTLSYYIKFT
ncbi:MAG: hypothetical protein ACR2JM_12515 [Mycobacterium sp.]